MEDNFCAEVNVTYVVSICSQRIFLTERLRDQGLPIKHLRMMYQVLIMSRLLCALPAWSCYLSAEMIGEIDAFLKKVI
jgi:hypothetical protein